MRSTQWPRRGVFSASCIYMQMDPRNACSEADLARIGASCFLHVRVAATKCFVRFAVLPLSARVGTMNMLCGGCVSARKMRGSRRVCCWFAMLIVQVHAVPEAYEPGVFAGCSKKLFYCMTHQSFKRRVSSLRTLCCCLGCCIAGWTTQKLHVSPRRVRYDARYC